MKQARSSPSNALVPNAPKWMRWMTCRQTRQARKGRHWQYRRNCPKRNRLKCRETCKTHLHRPRQSHTFAASSESMSHLKFQTLSPFNQRAVSRIKSRSQCLKALQRAVECVMHRSQRVMPSSLQRRSSILLRTKPRWASMTSSSSWYQELGRDSRMKR